MAGNLVEVFRSHGAPALAGFLEKLAGTDARILRDESRFRTEVADAAWHSLPVALRLMGKPKLRWDALIQAVRDELVSSSRATIALPRDLAGVIERLGCAVLTGVQPAPREKSRPHGEASGRHVASPLPHAPRATANEPSEPVRPVGIDLGTTYSVIAYLDDRGVPRSINNSAGDILTPSAVYFDDDDVLVGKEALKAGLINPAPLVVCVKRSMGEKVFPKMLKEAFLPPEVISSFILKSLKADAERKIGPIRQVVITVPAYFDEPRRQATVTAGQLAGFDVLEVINEPTAAAIAYGYQLGYLDNQIALKQTKPMRIVVYDLGGGTFDVTIVEMAGGSFRALATDGDVRLGGKDWDEKLVELAAAKFRQQCGVDPLANAETEIELWQAAEEAKRTLSERTRAMIVAVLDGKRQRVEVTAEEFEKATSALLRRTQTTTEIVVRQAGLRWDEIDCVLLVGGSTRMPMVSRMLEKLSGKPPNLSVSADEAVAHGASLYTSRLLQQRADPDRDESFSVTNVNSHSLGIVGKDPKTSREINHILIPKNSPLPTSKSVSFTTLKDDQRSVKIRIVEGESERPDACSSVGTAILRSIPPNLPKGYPGVVRYTYGEDGRLEVYAKLKGQPNELFVSFVRDNALPPGDLMLWAEYVDHGSSRF